VPDFKKSISGLLEDTTAKAALRCSKRFYKTTQIWLTDFAEWNSSIKIGRRILEDEKSCTKIRAPFLNVHVKA